MTPLVWAIIALSLALVVALASVAFAWYVYDLLRRDYEDQHDANHAKCIAHLADFSSKRVVALALRDTAERYDSVAGQREVRVLANEKWTPTGDHSIPALWMREQADLLDPPVERQGESK